MSEADERMAPLRFNMSVLELTIIGRRAKLADKSALSSTGREKVSLPPLPMTDKTHEMVKSFVATNPGGLRWAA